MIKLINNPDEKNGTKKIYNQFLAAAIVFFIPLSINIVMGMIGESSDFSSCWNDAEDRIVFSKKYYSDDRKKKTIFHQSTDYEKGKVRGGLAIAQLAVRVAPIAEPDSTVVLAPRNFHHDEISAKCDSYYTPNPWYPPSQVDARYKDFEKIMDAVINSERPGNKAYGSCAQASGGIIRAIANPDFDTSNPEGQIKYMNQNTEKWNLVYQMKLGEKFDDVCEPGDLLITDQGWTHTMIYVGSELASQKFSGTKENIFQAGYDDCDHAKYSRIDYMETTPVPFNVYRPTGKGNFKYSFIDVEQVLG